MSYSACSSSGLLFSPPTGDSAPYGAVGHTLTPAISTVTPASGGTLSVISTTVVPKGIWLVSGIVGIDATTAAATVTGNTEINKNGPTVLWRSANNTAQDSVSVTLSCIFDSDGNDTIDILATYTTSTGTFRAVAAPLSRVQITRIA